MGVMTEPYAECNLQRPWFALADKDGALFFIDEGRWTNKMVLCAVLRKAGWKLWCKIRVVHSKVLPVLRLIPSRTLFIFLICPTEVI